MHHSIDPHAAGRGMSNRRTAQIVVHRDRHRFIVIAILATLALDVRGVIFTGSASGTQVHAICTSGLGAFAQALNANAANACSEAGPVYGVPVLGPHPGPDRRHCPLRADMAPGPEGGRTRRLTHRRASRAGYGSGRSAPLSLVMLGQLRCARLRGSGRTLGAVAGEVRQGHPPRPSNGTKPSATRHGGDKSKRVLAAATAGATEARTRMPV